jgi:hypothetical protein
VALTIFPVTVIPHMLVGGLFLLVVSDIAKYLHLAAVHLALLLLVRLRHPRPQ